MKYLLVMLCVILAGCSNMPKMPNEVLIPISKSCITKEPTKPDFKAHETLKKLTEADYVLEITSEYLKYENYTGELEAVILGCR